MAAEESQQELDVDDSGTGQRLDLWLSGRIPSLTRSAVKRLISAGRIQVNHQKAKGGTQLKAGDRITLPADPDLVAEPATTLRPVPMDLDILYEDEDVLVVNKPAGIVVHPGAGETGATLLEGLLHHCGREADPGDPRPGIVHRLDKDTTGVMVYAKTSAALRHLAAQFQEKTNLREYVALLHGTMDDDLLEIESYLYRDPRHRVRYASMDMAAYQAAEAEGRAPVARYARSSFLRQKEWGHSLTLAAIRLVTGRTHQIRIHARDAGMPVVGDPVYHNKQKILPKDFPAPMQRQIFATPRQLLHAKILGFTHPVSGRKLGFEAPLPDDFRVVLELLDGASSPS